MSRRRVTDHSSDKSDSPDSPTSAPQNSLLSSSKSQEKSKEPTLDTPNLGPGTYPKTNPTKRRLACLIWISIAVAVNYRCDIAGVVAGGRYYVVPFRVGILCFSISFLLFLYVYIIVQTVQKREITVHNWRYEIPKEIGIATTAATAGFFSFALAGYKEWGVLSVLVVTSQLMGLFFTMAIF